MTISSLMPSLKNKLKHDQLEDRNTLSYLGSFVCNIWGDKAYLYLKEEQLEAHLYSRKGEVAVLFKYNCQCSNQLSISA